MPVSPPARKLTYADFLLFPDDGKRHELIDGVHYVTPSPNLGHQELVGRLYLAIGNFLSTRRHLGRVFLSPLDVVMSDYDVVEPDLLFVAGDQQGDSRRGERAGTAGAGRSRFSRRARVAARRYQASFSTRRVFASTGWSIRRGSGSRCAAARLMDRPDSRNPDRRWRGSVIDGSLAGLCSVDARSVRGDLISSRCCGRSRINAIGRLLGISGARA